MKTKYVKIHDIDDVSAFIDLATKVDGDVVCHRGRFAVDAASVMGVMSIGVSGGITVEYPDDATALDIFLDNFVEGA